MAVFSRSLAALAMGLALVSSAWADGPATQPAKLTPADLSTIRGANYRGANAADTTDYWKHYDPAETERDFSYADKLKLNSLRVFVNEAAWLADKGAFRKNVADLAHAAARHHLGLLMTVGDSASFLDADGSINRERINAFATELDAALGAEPALAFWDASNEPDYNAAGTPADRQTKRMEIARLMAAKLHELDKTPVTIGVASERNMEVLADAVDVLSFHDYLPTRGAIAGDIARAKDFAAHAGKQVMDTETGCIARANPYDVALEEHMKAKVGWYVWELMITKKWGTVHGVFYPDGTVRDPAIPAAILGLFRNRGDDVVLENVNRESWVNTDVKQAQAWLDDAAGNWHDGLLAAEKLSNLLEAAQLTPMREPPSRTLALLGKGQPDAAALRKILPGYIALLTPFERPNANGSTGVRPSPLPETHTPHVAYPLPRREGSRTPADTSTIVGANYSYATTGTGTMWANYKHETTERDLARAQGLGINQLRVFINYTAYQADPVAFKANLIDLVRSADAHGIGIMPVVSYGQAMRGEGHPGAEEWAKFLVDTLGKEPGLAFWDVHNEPDYPLTPEATATARSEFAKYMAGVFRRLDGHTPVTIGFAYEATMEKYADDVDVLVFHNYQQSREAVKIDIEKARLAGAKVKKQAMDDEMGCVARANPYDMTIQEHMNAHMGFYLWELMIVTSNARAWGDVHGIFYPDGTVRDPSIPMAVLGIFRNRGPDVVLEQPDREGRVTRTVAEAKAWVVNATADWDAGLDIAETAANLLESAQLVALHELPTRQAMAMRRGNEDRPALRALLEKDIAALQPFTRQQ